MKENILRQNYIVVQTNYRFADKAAFDLKNESYVAMYLSEAVKDGKLYHGYKKVSNEGKKEFELSKRDLLRYSMLVTSVTQKQIRDSNFKLKQPIPKKAQQRLKEIEPYFRNDKMIVEYNQNYLPIKVKLYDTKDKKWDIYTKYFYTTRQKYEKELNECIEAVLNGDFGEE